MVLQGSVVRTDRHRPRPPHSLPVQLTSFVGRRRESHEVARELSRTRLLSLTGPGGSGKTRLALQLAAAVLDDHPGGVWWLELASISDPDLVGPGLANTLGVRPLPGQSDLDAAVSFLSGRRALVVLDNCEHLLDSVTDVASALAVATALIASQAAPAHEDSPVMSGDAAPEGGLHAVLEEAPRIRGLQVRLLQGPTPALFVRNDTRWTLKVLGRRGRPVVRVRPRGAWAWVESRARLARSGGFGPRPRTLRRWTTPMSLGASRLRVRGRVDWAPATGLSRPEAGTWLLAGRPGAALLVRLAYPLR